MLYMLYSCTHMATVGVKGLKRHACILCWAALLIQKPWDTFRYHSIIHLQTVVYHTRSVAVLR